MNDTFHINHLSAQLQAAIDSSNDEAFELIDPETGHTKYVLLTIADYDELCSGPFA